MLISIIIPVHNEEKTILEILSRLVNLDFNKEIIIVDDGSTDNTISKIESFIKTNPNQNIYTIKHHKNIGKGYAIKTGLEKAKGQYTIIQDADLEYYPEDIVLLLKETPEYQAVFGKRNYKKGYIHYRIGAFVLTKILNILFNSSLSDIYTCYKLIDTDLFKTLNLSKNGFEIEVEITTKLLKRKIFIKEIPINYNPRKFNEGKKIRISDGIRGLITIIKEFFV